MHTCHNCQQEFLIDEQDQAFYQKIDIPLPGLCPNCRKQRRLSLRNELNLYKRHCDLCKQEIVAIFPADSQYTVYCYTCWWSDKWDPLDYGQDYDPNRPFFEQFSQLEKSIPHFALFQDPSSENCPYTNYGLGNKSCYLAFCFSCENVYYSHGAILSKSCMDIQKCVSCELCYDCIDCTGCYNLNFSKDSANCKDSDFLEDCSGCSDCFCSAGLRNKRFVFMNQQLTEEEYRTKMKEITLTNESIPKYKKQLHEISIKIPKKYMHGINNQNVTGDYIDNCKNIKQCFDCINEFEKSAYSDFCGAQSFDCYDCSYGGIGMDLCYEMNGIVSAHNCKSIYAARNIQECNYCQYIYSCENLFGCIGLRHKKYSILNKTYSEAEYHKLRTTIIANMKKNQEWGEFFPIKISPVAYNESVASEYYPLSKEEVLAKGWQWREINPITAENIQPDDKTQICQECNKTFRMIDSEVTFYQNKELPLPTSCPRCRYNARFKQRNPRKLWSRQCQKCAVDFQTSYSPERPEIIYCEKCYLKAVY